MQSYEIEQHLGNLRKSTEIFWNQLKSYEKIEILRKTLEYHWKSNEIIGNLMKSVEIVGNDTKSYEIICIMNHKKSLEILTSYEIIINLKKS